MLKYIPLILIGIFVVAGTYFTFNYFLIPKFNVPTVSDYVKMAKPWIPTVQAAYDYQADHGVMPKKLQDLVPNYLTTLPSDPNGLQVSFDEYGLSIHAPVPHTGIVYSFMKGYEGWEVGGDFGVGALPMPKIASTHPTAKQRRHTRAATTRTTTAPVPKP